MNCGITGELKVTGFLLAVVKGYSLVPINGTKSIRKRKKVYNTFLSC